MNQQPPIRIRWRTAARYLWALAFVALAAMVRWVLPGVLGDAPHLPFYMAIVAAAALCGWKPGLLATVASALCVDVVFTPPLWQLSPDPVEWARQVIFVLGGTGISLLAGRLHAAKALAQQEAAAVRQAAEALRASEERFRTLYEQGPLAIALADLDERFVRVNPVFCAMLGYSEAELLGRSFEELTCPEDRPATAEAAQQLFGGATGSYHLEKRYLRKDGTAIWCRVNACLLRDEAGQPRYAVGMIEDISRRKADEAALRTAMDAAQAAQLQAEQANAAKDQFLATLSHELRTPLTPVLTTVAMLQQDPRCDADTREQLEIARRNAELEARLIDDLLDVTRIARGKVELDKRPVELCTIIRRAVEVCQPDIEARRLTFRAEPDESPHVVCADAARLQQVFWNLLKNAIKFTPPGGCVGIRCRTDGPGHVVTEVYDNGLGIEPEVLGRLFQPFEQGERTITRRFGGLGLGLVISKAITDMHGGTIEARSPGKDCGATFCVRLPLAPALAARPVGANVPGRSATRPLRILLVEDHGDTARTMKRLLTAQGHRVATAADVATALKLAAEQTYDLLVSDLGLPDGSGLDLLRTLRARGSDLSAIALSGYGQDQDIAQSRAAGFAAHLTKPVNLQTLATVMDQVTCEAPGAAVFP